MALDLTIHSLGDINNAENNGDDISNHHIDNDGSAVIGGDGELTLKRVLAKRRVMGGRDGLVRISRYFGPDSNPMFGCFALRCAFQQFPNCSTPRPLLEDFMNTIGDQNLEMFSRALYAELKAKTTPDDLKRLDATKSFCWQMCRFVFQNLPHPHKPNPSIIATLIIIFMRQSAKYNAVL